MDVSIIIVNYNVKYFLEQCLKSIYNAKKNLEIEIYVVDNNSVDGSSKMIKENFPDVKLIQNKQNVGFAKANNQALKLCKGKYVLILNPDTVLQEDTLVCCFDFMEKHPDAGACTVKMINGKGKFLPESKRGLPTPEVAFYKMFGINKLFPHSRRFNKYYLGHLNNDEINEIEILPGAFMFIRKSVLDIVGFFDENFFMYGEDVDLSYRILKAGYKNYYVPATKIIHYKGESTKKGSLNYYLVFYQAMLIFSKKHFSNKYVKAFNILIHLAIYFRGFLSVMRKFLLTVLYPVLIFLITYFLYKIFLDFWAITHFNNYNYYPENVFRIVLPSIIIAWIIILYISGALNKKSSLREIVKGILLGLFFVLVIYSLFPSNFRFSRLAILLGSFFVLIGVISSRIFLNLIAPEELPFSLKRRKRNVVVVGSVTEYEKVKKILSFDNKLSLIGIVSGSNNYDENYYLGEKSQLSEIVRIYNVDEIIFCGSDIPASEIISIMLNLSDYNIDFKILPPESFFIVGTNSVSTYEDLYTLPLESIFSNLNRNKKRIFDLICSIFLLLLFPIVSLFIKNKKQALKNILYVFKGKYTFVGFNFNNSNDFQYLIKPSIFSPLDIFDYSKLLKIDDEKLVFKVLFNYLKNYRMQDDFLILLKALKKIDRKIDL